MFLASVLFGGHRTRVSTQPLKSGPKSAIQSILNQRDGQATSTQGHHQGGKGIPPVRGPAGPPPIFFYYPFMVPKASYGPLPFIFYITPINYPMFFFFFVSALRSLLQGALPKAV